MTEACPEAPQTDGYPMPHDYNIEYGEVGENGFASETSQCIHCGETAYDLTPEEVEERHVADLIHEGQVTEDDLPDEILEAEVVQEALERRPGT